MIFDLRGYQMAKKNCWKITIFCLSISNSQVFLQYCIWLPLTLEVIECPKKLFKIMTFEIQFYICSHSILNRNFKGFKHYMYFTRFSTTLWKWPMTSKVINWKGMQKKDLFWICFIYIVIEIDTHYDRWPQRSLNT